MNNIKKNIFAIAFLLTTTTNSYAQCFKEVYTTIGSVFAKSNDQRIWCWGWNKFYQLGLGDTINRIKPTLFSNDTNWLQIKGGNSFTIGMRNNHSLWAWGKQTWGELGNGMYNEEKYFPIQIGNSTDWLDYSCGYYHSLAIRNNGTLWAWGKNDYYALGDSTIIDRASPIQIGFDNDWVFINAYDKSSLAIKKDGTLWAWGNFNASFIPLTFIYNKTPKQLGNENNWLKISHTNSYALALKTDSTLWAWGTNNKGELGIGGNGGSSAPIQIGVKKNWYKISTLGFTSIAMNAENEVFAWGQNQFGQFGDSTKVDGDLPKRVGTNKAILDYVLCGSTLALLDNNGNIWTTGHNKYGTLGNNTTTHDSIFQLAIPIDCTPLQVSSNEPAKSIIVNPNPTNNYIHISTFSNNRIPVYIFNIFGQKIFETITQEKLLVDVSAWPSGIYFIKTNHEVIKFEKI